MFPDLGCFDRHVNNARTSTRSDDGMAAQSPAPPQCRSCRRLHFSTWVVAGVALAILTLIVIPGRVNNHDAFTAAPLFYEHGWPFVFLDRFAPPPPVLPGSDSDAIDFLRSGREREGLRSGWTSDELLGWSQDGFCALRAFLVGRGQLVVQGRIGCLPCRSAVGPCGGLCDRGCGHAPLRMVGSQALAVFPAIPFSGPCSCLARVFLVAICGQH